MRAFGKDFKTANIEVVVTSVHKGGKSYRIEWSIGDNKYSINHGKAFFKVKKLDLQGGEGGGMDFLAGPDEVDEELEDVQEGGRAGREDDEESEGSERDEGELVDGDQLKCKLKKDVHVWEFKENEVSQGPWAAAGVADTTYTINWSNAASGDGKKTVEKILEQALPMEFFTSTEFSPGWTNDALPSNIVKFTKHELRTVHGSLAGQVFGWGVYQGPLEDLE